MYENIITSQESSYVDLGLPSGTMWKSSNERHPSYNVYVFLTDDEIVSLFGHIKDSDWEKREQECRERSWTGSGFKIIGPTGNSFFLPAFGSRGANGHLWNPGCVGCYWSSAKCDESDVYYYCFGSDGHQVSHTHRLNGLSVRLVQD